MPLDGSIIQALRPKIAVPQGLIGYWPLDLGSLNWGGNRAYDRSGNNRHATLGNITSSALARGKVREAITFNGTNQYAQVASFPYAGEISFAAWVRRIGGFATNFQAIASHHTTSGVASDWYIYFHSDNKVHIDIPWVLGDVIVSDVAVTDSNWHFIGFSRSGSAGSWTYKLYADRTIKSATTASNPVNSGWNFNLASVDGSAQFANQDMDEVHIYGRVLSAQEFLSKYEAGRCGRA